MDEVKAGSPRSELIKNFVKEAQLFRPFCHHQCEVEWIRRVCLSFPKSSHSSSAIDFFSFFGS